MSRHRDTNLKWTGMVKSILLFFIGLGVTTASQDQSLISNECKLPNGNSLIPGSKIEIKSFPFLASYGFRNDERDDKSWNHICTASILSKRALLTAAHCLRLLEQIESEALGFKTVKEFQSMTAS